MTREEARKAAEVMLAYANGEEIETLCFNDYISCDNPSFNWINGKGIKNYRIKPKPKYRPFENQKECWNEMLKHQPFGWVKAPNGELFCIDKVFDEGVVYKHSSCRFEEYLEGNCTFADGIPFGIKED